MNLTHILKLMRATVIAIILSGCASAQSMGRDYSAAGRHELAVQYYAHAFVASPDSESTRTDFHRALDLANRQLDADYEQAEQAGQYRKAYAIAIRKAEMMQWAYKLRLQGIDPASSGSLVEKSRVSARREAVSLVDAAEESNAPPKKLLRLLREAIALDPDNTELNDRYARLQKRLERHITLSTQCPVALQSICNAALRELTEKLTSVRRELFSVSTHQSQVASASLVLNLNVKTVNGNWVRKRTGRVSSKVKRLNDLREEVKNARGKKVYDEFAASYSTFAQTNKATVHASIRIRDLRPNQPDLYVGKSTKQEKSTTRYYDWSGDERAFNDHPNIRNLGTNRHPAISTDILTRRAWEKAISELAQAIVVKLEN